MKNPEKISTRLRAYAKLNIGLFIKGKQSDNFHEIETLLIPIKLFDKITINRIGNDINIKCNNPYILVDDNNLAYRAFQKLKEKYFNKIKGGVEIIIEKNIPIGAGLGGGSSDAAAVLLGVRHLWNLKISDNILKKLASEVGSDAPFFIDCQPSIATGRGEKLKKVRFNVGKWILLVYPDIKVSTAWAYENFNFILTNCAKNVNFAKLIKKNIFKFKNLILNNLELPVFSRYPVIENIKNDLYEYGAEFALMSGSGSCVYGLFKSKGKVIEVGEKFRKYGDIYITRQVLTPEIFY